MKFFLAVITAAGLWTGTAGAESAVFRRQVPRYFFHVGAGYLYTGTSADAVSGATYRESYASPIVFEASVGAVVQRPIYVGIRYEHWLGRRNFMLGGTNQIDTLAYRALGADVGVVFGNPRVYWMALASVQYPLRAQIESTAGTFNPDYYRFTFSGRVRVGIRVVPFASLALEGGFRFQDLGVFAAEGQPYLPAATTLDLSGAFLGLGVLLHI